MDWYTLRNETICNYMLRYRNDLLFFNQIPDIITQGIIRIYNNAKDIGFEQQVNINLNANNFQIDKPGGWRETISLSLTDVQNNTIFLQERTYEFLKTYLPNPALVNTPPKYYANVPTGNLMNNSAYNIWQISPSADKAYTVNVIYLGIPVFNNDNRTNFLTQRYPNLLLYSCLLEASIFLDNEEKRNKYEGLFGKELETILNINQSRMTDRTVSRDKS